MHRWAMRILVAGGMLVLASSAGGHAVRSGGQTTWKDPAGDVRGAGLTRAERDAVDIVSVRVAGQEGLGLFATITFKGDFQKAVGRGHLRKTVAGIILRPKAAATSIPAMLLTAGPGTGTVYRKTRSETVGAARDGRTLELAIIGPGFDAVGSVDVKVLVNGPQLPSGASRRPPVLVLPLDPSAAASFGTSPGADVSHGLPRYGSLTCPQLAELIRGPHARALFGAGLEGLENEYAERCGTQGAAYEFDFGTPPLCFVNNGTTTDVEFRAMRLHPLGKGISVVPVLVFPEAFPPATGTLELRSSSGFDQTKPLTFDSTGSANVTTFTLTSFGDYSAEATANVAGQTVRGSTSFTLNKANDITTC